MKKQKAKKKPMNIYAPERVSTTIDCGLFDELWFHARERGMTMEELGREAYEFYHMVKIGDDETNTALAETRLQYEAQKDLESLPAVGASNVTLIH